MYSNVASMAMVKNATKGKPKKKVELAPKAETDSSQWLKGTNVNFNDPKAKPRAKPRVAAPAVVAEPAVVVAEVPKVK